MQTRSRKLLAPALSLGFLAIAFRFDDATLAWLWSAQPGVAAALACAAAGLAVAAWTRRIRPPRAPRR